MGNGSTLPVARGSVDLFSFLANFSNENVGGPPRRPLESRTSGTTVENLRNTSRPADDRRRRRYVY